MNQSVSDAVAPLYSRLRINIGTTNGSGNISITVPGIIYKVGQQFSIGDEIFTVTTLGTPGVMLTTGSSTVHTYNTTTGAVVINGAATTTDIYFYPAEPVMGLANFEDTTVNFEPLFAFDTQFSYQFINGGWEILGPIPPGATTGLWSGTDADYFWAYNYRGTDDYQTFLFVTNFVAADQIKFWDNDTSTWTTINPSINGTDTIETCRCIVAFQSRLLLFNTVENTGGTDRSFVNRVRWSKIGPPDAADAFRTDSGGLGGVLDAPTKEAIVSVELLRNTLIVFFERSTWTLAYTNNAVSPFIWQQLNSELGVESTFSIIPFDKVALGIGDVGIHACNGVNIERIDEKIPNEVFEIQNADNGTSRVAGIRDYKSEVVYWSIPTTSKYCNQLIVYNYNNGTWAIVDDSFTAFGYYQPQDALVWSSANFEWQASDAQWDSGAFQARFRNVAAGNQQGFVMVVCPDCLRNSPALQISAINNVTGVITIIDHNLVDDSYILIENSQGTTSINDTIFNVKIIDEDNIEIYDVNEAQVIPVDVYTGGATVALVSEINILTKQYNFYDKTGQTAQINKINFMVDRTESGEIIVDTLVSASNISLVEKGVATGAIMGNGTLETYAYPTIPFESTQARLWHTQYVQAEGQVVQLNLYFSPEQVSDPNIATSDFQLHAMIFYARPGSSRLG